MRWNNIKRDKKIETIKILGIVVLSLVSFLLVDSILDNYLVNTLNNMISASGVVLIPAAIALFISYLLSPIVKIVKNKLKISDYFAISIVYFFIIIIVGLFSWFAGEFIMTAIKTFGENIWPSISGFIDNKITPNIDLNEIWSNISEQFMQDGELDFQLIIDKLNEINADNLLIGIFSVIGSFFSLLIGVIMTAILTPVFLFFMLKDKSLIFNIAIYPLPDKAESHIRELGRRSNIVIEKYFNGKFISMFIMSIVNAIGFGIILLVGGMPFGTVLYIAILFGFILGFLDIIPYLGPFVGIILPVLYVLAEPVEFYGLHAIWTAIAILAFNFIAQAFQGNILQPIIFGKEVDIHPLIVLMSFLFFGALFGVVGVILAVPIAGVLRVTVDYVKEVNRIELEE